MADETVTAQPGADINEAGEPGSGGEAVGPFTEADEEAGVAFWHGLFLDEDAVPEGYVVRKDLRDFPVPITMNGRLQDPEDGECVLYSAECGGVRCGKRLWVHAGDVSSAAQTSSTGGGSDGSGADGSGGDGAVAEEAPAEDAEIQVAQLWDMRWLFESPEGAQKFFSVMYRFREQNQFMNGEEVPSTSVHVGDVCHVGVGTPDVEEIYDLVNNSGSAQPNNPDLPGQFVDFLKDMKEGSVLDGVIKAATGVTYVFCAGCAVFKLYGVGNSSHPLTLEMMHAWAEEVAVRAADAPQHVAVLKHIKETKGADAFTAPVPGGGIAFQYSCANDCGAAGTKICTGCRSVHYCSKECQKKHWKAHKRICRLLRQSVAHFH